MKAIILARASTKQQEEGHSIGAQRRRLAIEPSTVPSTVALAKVEAWAKAEASAKVEAWAKGGGVLYH